jgi:hypothetical protein
MNTHFSTPDPRHLWGDDATHPRGLFLNALDSVTNPRDTHGIGRGLRLARAFKNRPLGRVQLPDLG